MSVMIQRAIVVLNTRPEAEREKELAALVVENYAEDDITEYSWELSDFLPAKVGDDVADELIEIRHSSGPDSCYMIVWMK